MSNYLRFRVDAGQGRLGHGSFDLLKGEMGDVKIASASKSGVDFAKVKISKTGMEVEDRNNDLLKALGMPHSDKRGDIAYVVKLKSLTVDTIVKFRLSGIGEKVNKLTGLKTVTLKYINRGTKSNEVDEYGFAPTQAYDIEVIEEEPLSKEDLVAEKV